jgi:hypothetical protein
VFEEWRERRYVVYPLISLIGSCPLLSCALDSCLEALCYMRTQTKNFKVFCKWSWGVYEPFLTSLSLAFFTDDSYAFISKMQASPRISSRVNSRPAQKTEKKSRVAVRCFLGSEKPGRLWLSSGALFLRYTKDGDEDIDARYGLFGTCCVG